MILMSVAYCSSSLSSFTFGYVWCFLITNSACRQRPEAGPCLFQQLQKSVADGWISDLLRDWPCVYFQMHPDLWAAETWEDEKRKLKPGSWDVKTKFKPDSRIWDAVEGAEATLRLLKYPQSSVDIESACWLSQTLMVLCLQELYSGTRKHWLSWL